jgi:hypothetical protein
MKYYYFFSFLLLFIHQFAIGQENSSHRNTESEILIVDPIEKSAKFVNEKESVNEYLKSKLNFSTEGRIVRIKFEVNKSGKVENVKILKGLNKKKNLQIVTEVLKMPNWIPSTQNGQPIRSEIILQLQFK